MHQPERKLKSFCQTQPTCTKYLKTAGNSTSRQHPGVLLLSGSGPLSRLSHDHVQCIYNLIQVTTTLRRRIKA
jgi:hypothetical protein